MFGVIFYFSLLTRSERSSLKILQSAEKLQTLKVGCKGLGLDSNYAIKEGHVATEVGVTLPERLPNNYRN